MTDREGQWIVVDADNGARHMTLLQCGNEHFGGVSVRKNLGRVARELVFHPLEQAVTEGQPTKRTVTMDGVQWDVVVDPLLSPLTKQPVGAVACYVESGQPFPPRPLIGALEWRITQDTRETFWDKQMAQLYDISNTDVVYHVDGDLISLPSSQWLATFISAEDQHKLQRLIDEATDSGETTKRRARIAYKIEHPKTGVVKMLEFSARNFTTDDGVMLFRGFSREVPQVTDLDVPDELTVPQPEVSAIAELTADVPMVQVKRQTSEMVQMLPGWRQANFAAVPTMRFLDLVAADQRAHVAALLTAQTTSIRAMLNVRIRHASQQWRTYTVLVKDLADSYVMVRLKR